ncbi:MFS transporter [Rhodococcoides kyotonense]|uniref:MFS transporter, AAHS family, benzoate transport protein n=1 Tax=Rhodococcoides kyotonense TaxID=398843 RepID=A0A239MZ84_9NOCA|nr:MFS transporter [Rhodococcus kyotonensis]SNT47464.1 MFS transporter, AAHS family, benzoate transport protein [Rhodococcus kyotonensis]
MSAPASPWLDARHRSSVLWIVGIATLAMIFDGYDMVVYGTILPLFLNDPTQLGVVTAQTAGLLGSWALIGIMVGALMSGAIGDYVGRRKMMLVSIVWFSIGMAATALTTSVAAFGVTRFLTGIGMGGLIVTVGALIAEFAPPDRKNLYNAIVYGGFAVGGVLASASALVVRDSIGWRGMFWLGALPLVIVLPLAYFKMPESPRWLIAHDKLDEANEIARTTGIPSPVVAEVHAERDTTDKVGFAALVTRQYLFGTIVLGWTVFACLLLIFGLNTWLPKIMENAGYNTSKSLWFLVVLNGGAVIGALLASRFADRHGPQRIIAGMFAMAGLALVILTLPLPLPLLLVAVAIAGAGTTGTQVVIWGFVANYYTTTARAAGMAWCAGFGRLGGIFGPVIGGIIIGATLGNDVAFFIFTGVAVVASVLTMLVPRVRVRDLRNPSLQDVDR